ncbi:MMPL family transporter, partial [bacterium]|nr:MMPL family transporter [bacterium]
KRQFGSDTSVVIALKPVEIFNQEFLITLKSLHTELEEKVPYVDEVTSLINITAIRGESGELIIEDLFETWPETKEDIQRIKEYVFNHPDYVNNIISKDGVYTLILVRADVFMDENGKESARPDEKTELTNAQNNQIVNKVNEIVKKYQSDKVQIFITGGPVIDKLHVDVIGATVRKTIGISIICVFFLLFMVFRRLSGVVIPLLIVLLSLVTTFGIMSMVGIPIRVTSQAFPPIVLAAGICDAVHLFSIFYQRLKITQDKRQSIVHAIKHSGLAMIFTTLTTAGGFLSFYFADLKGISEMGISAAIGVLCALIYTFLLVPSLIAVLPIKMKSQPEKQSTKKPGWEKLLEVLATFSVTRPYFVLIPTVLIIIVSSIGASNLKFSFNMIKWFPEEMKVDAHNTIIEENFKSSATLEIIIDTEKENGLLDPKVMNAIEAAQKYAESIQTGPVKVGKTNSIVNSLKLINKVLNNDQPTFYEIPQNKKAIAQEMILFENSGWDNLEESVDSQFSKARITIGVPTVNSVNYVPFGNQIKIEMEKIFSGIAKVSLTGNVDIGARNILGLMKSLSESYLLAFVIIGVLMIFLLGSVRIGLVSMIPNFLPILMTLGLMGFLNIPITMFSVLLGGIALGLAVDDTIHFLHNFKRCFDSNNSIITSVIETIRTTGRALFFTSVVMSIGFASYLVADMNILVTFGVIISLTVALAFLADMTVTPALVAIVYASKEKQNTLVFSKVS